MSARIGPGPAAVGLAELLHWQREPTGAVLHVRQSLAHHRCWLKTAILISKTPLLPTHARLHALFRAHPWAHPCTPGAPFGALRMRPAGHTLQRYDEVMAESGRQREERLERDGQLEAFRARWKELRAQCETKPERQAAWAQTVEEFAPKSPEAAPEMELVDPAVFTGRDCKASDAIVWAAQNHQEDNVTPTEAPSPLAWSLVLWIRRGGEQAFWSSVYGRLMPGRRQVLDEPTDEDYRRMMEMCDKAIEQERQRKRQSSARTPG